MSRGIRLIDGAWEIRKWIENREVLFKEIDAIERFYELKVGKLSDWNGEQKSTEYDREYYERYGNYEWNEWHDNHARLLMERTKCTSMIDLGCGYGNIVLGFLHNGVDAWGLEFSHHAVEYASGELEGRVLWGDIKNADTLPKRKFDLVLGYDLLEHAPEPEKVVANICCLSSRWIHVKAPDIRGLNPEESRRFDPTHITGRSIKFWIEEFEKNGFILIFDEGFTLLKFDPEYALGAVGAPDLHGLFRRRVQYK